MYFHFHLAALMIVYHLFGVIIFIQSNRKTILWRLWWLNTAGSCLSLNRLELSFIVIITWLPLTSYMRYSITLHYRKIVLKYTISEFDFLPSFFESQNHICLTSRFCYTEVGNFLLTLEDEKNISRQWVIAIISVL